MASIASLSRSVLLLMALSSVACGKKEDIQKNYTIVKTEEDELQRVAGQLLAESNRLLEEEFSGAPAERSAWEHARERQKWENVLYLPYVQTLNITQAKAIAENASWVSLNGLERLSPEVSQKIFSKGYTYIEMNGLKELSPEIVLHMGNVIRGITPGNTLVLNGLEEITPEIAQILMREEASGYIHLGGITSISDEVVQIISRAQPDVRKRFVRLHMPNLELTPELAKKLPDATFSSVIEKEKVLSDDLVEMIALSQLKYVHLDHLTDIQPTHLSAILRQKREILSLDGLSNLNRETLKELVRCSPEFVSLDGVEVLSKEDIDVLIQSQIKDLSLKGLEQKEYKKLAQAFRTTDRSISFKNE